MKTIWITIITILILQVNLFSEDEAIKYYNTGVEEYNKGQFKEAIVNFKKATVFDPEYIKAWYWLAYSYYKIDDLEGAKNICNSLLNDLKVTGEYKEKVIDLSGKIETKLSVQNQKTETKDTLKIFILNLIY